MKPRGRRGKGLRKRSLTTPRSFSLLESVRRKRLIILCLLSLTTAGASGAQTGAPQDTTRTARSNWWGNWAARSRSGVTLNGTWTAAPGQKAGTVVGTWTLADAQGEAVANGAWSAAKAPAGWSGAWRAVVAGKPGDYTGTWTAIGDFKGDASFGDLFEKAVQATVGGAWAAGRQSGAWSIRAAKPEFPKPESR